MLKLIRNGWQRIAQAFETRKATFVGYGAASVLTYIAVVLISLVFESPSPTLMAVLIGIYLFLCLLMWLVVSQNRVAGDLLGLDEIHNKRFDLEAQAIRQLSQELAALNRLVHDQYKSTTDAQSSYLDHLRELQEDMHSEIARMSRGHYKIVSSLNQLNRESILVRGHLSALLATLPNTLQKTWMAYLKSPEWKALPKLPPITPEEAKLVQPPSESGPGQAATESDNSSSSAAPRSESGES